MSELITLENVGQILSNISSELITNQNLLKLIKYDTPDALSQKDLTRDEIRALMGKSIDDPQKTLQRIYKSPTTNKITDTVHSELRLFIPNITPDNIYLSKLSIAFQVINYYSLIDLDDNKNRSLTIVQEILKTINGFDSGSIGLLYLSSPIVIQAWNENFSGYRFEMQTRTT